MPTDFGRVRALVTRALLSFLSFSLCLIALALSEAPARAQAPSVRDPHFVIERLYRGNGMISIEFGPGGRLYVAEKVGRILTFEPNGSGQFRAPTVLADFRTAISFEQESGLLGMVVDPDFINTRQMFLLYTTPLEQKIVRIELTPSFDQMVDGSETVILDGLPRYVSFHKSGDLQFHPLEPDVLYATIGDDGLADLSQDPTLYNGKLIRISKYDGFGLADNPFYDGDPTSIASRVWAMGMRNPFRFVFDPASPVPDAAYVSERGATTARYSWVRRGATGGWSEAGDQFLCPSDTNFRILGTVRPFLCGIAIADGGPFGDPDAPDASVLFVSNP